MAKQPDKDGKQPRKPKKPLSGLAAALVSAGHLDEKKAQQILRDKREAQRRAPEGGGGRQGGDRGRGAGRPERPGPRRGNGPAPQGDPTPPRAAPDDAGPDEAARAEASALVGEHRCAKIGGRRRWFFVDRSGQVEFVEVNDEIARALGSGDAAVVESLSDGGPPHCVVRDRAAIDRLATLDPQLVRFRAR